MERTLSADETSRTWYRQNPPLPRVKWSLRNNNNYEQTGLLVSLNYIANNRAVLPAQLLREEQALDHSRRSTEGPAAYVLPATDPRLGAQAELLRVLQKQARGDLARDGGVHRARCRCGGRPAGGGAAGGRWARRWRGRGRRGRGWRGRRIAGNTGHAAATSTETREFPAGSYIVRMDQPYSRIADALLDYQYWAPNDPQTNPYDDTGWTFPEASPCRPSASLDAKVLDAPMELVKGPDVGRRAASSARRRDLRRSTTTPTTRSSRCATG